MHLPLELWRAAVLGGGERQEGAGAVFFLEEKKGACRCHRHESIRIACSPCFLFHPPSSRSTAAATLPDVSTRASTTADRPCEAQKPIASREEI